MMGQIVKLYKLGRLSYQQALIAQQFIFGQLKQTYGWVSKSSNQLGTEDKHESPRILDACSQEHHKYATNSLLLVEHEPVYTIGIRSRHYDDVYIAELMKTVAQHGLKADFFHANRGGLITYHGPGQLVAYPIINLNHFPRAIPNRSVKAYVRALESVIIDTLDGVGLKGSHTLREYPGVWLDNGERKIAFIGISCKRFITMHGISINCNCDLTWFDFITSCGIEGKAITSIRQEFLSLYKARSGSSQALLGPSSSSPSTWPSSSSNDDKLSSAKPAMLEPEITDSFLNELSVHHIANQFCASFSRHFQCDLLEEEFPWASVTDC